MAKIKKLINLWGFGGVFGDNSEIMANYGKFVEICGKL